MKLFKFKNKLNGEQVVCNNIRDIHTIDGVEYLLVHKEGQTRTFLMRKDALEKVPFKAEKIS